MYHIVFIDDCSDSIVSYCTQTVFGPAKLKLKSLHVFTGLRQGGSHQSRGFKLKGDATLSLWSVQGPDAETARAGGKPPGWAAWQPPPSPSLSLTVGPGVT